MMRRNTSSLRSYQPPASNHWRSSSIGGCAPYSSTIGMLMSSTKTMNFFPAVGPYTPLRRFSHFESMRSCVWFALVWAEKVMHSGTYLSLKPVCRCELMLTVLPVPVGPDIITCLLFVTSSSSRWR